MEKLKILVVDDESRMRKLVRDFLEREGFAVIEAGDGQEAVEIFYENKDIEYTYYESETETWAKGVIEKYVKEPKKPSVIPVKPGSWREYYAQYYKGGYHNTTPTGGGVAKNDWAWDYDD